MSDGTAPSTRMDALLSSILSDPAALSKIQDVLAKHGIVQSHSGGQNPPPSEKNNDVSANFNENNVKNDESSPTFKGDGANGTSDALGGILSLLPKNLPCADSRQTALLLAIKPYLSPKRAELIEGFLKIEKLGSLLKNLGSGGNNVLQ